VIIDLSDAHMWDTSAVAALDAVETHYASHDVQVEITGLNSRSEQLRDRHTGQTVGH
jgi:SulP family sulfate permease